MSEPITPALVLEQLQRLYIAFPTHQGMKTNPRGTAEVYRESLDGLTGEALGGAVRFCIDTGKFFPKVVELREAAHEWTRRNTVHIDRRPGGELECPNCHTEPQWLARWRPRVDDRRYLVLSPDRQHVALERYERLLCRCAPPGAYAPLTSVGEPWMLVSDLPTVKVYRVRGAVIERKGP